MSFLDDFKLTLQQTITDGAFTDARRLLQGFHRTHIPYDAELFYLEAALCYYEAHYPLSAFFARLGYEKYPDFTPLHELLSYLAETGCAFDDYTPKPTFDCSFLNRTMRIVLYENVLPIMDYTADQFHKAFELLGHEVFVFHHNDFAGSSAALLEFAKDGIDFAIVFNNTGSLMTDSEGRNFWELMDIPCINYLFDHPFYYEQVMEKMPTTAVVTCVDRNHVNYIRRFYPNVKHTFFFPLGSELIPQKLPLAWKERPIDVLYVGNLKIMPDAPSSVISRVVERYLTGHPSLTTETAFEHCLNALIRAHTRNDINVSNIEAFQDIELLPEDFEAPSELSVDDSLLKQVIHKYRYTDMNVNSHFRKAMIVSLVNAGIDVHVYGNGWELPELTSNPHFHFCGFVSQTECIEKMQQSKIVLNSMPWFKDGAHDRIFNAMLCHSVCVTDGSKYLMEQFTDQKEIVFYSLEEMEQLPVIVKSILYDPPGAELIAENGYQKAILSHNWETRALELLTRVFRSEFDS